MATCRARHDTVIGDEDKNLLAIAMSETEGETPAAEGTHAAAAPVNAVCIATHASFRRLDDFKGAFTKEIDNS